MRRGGDHPLLVRETFIRGRSLLDVKVWPRACKGGEVIQKREEFFSAQLGRVVRSFDWRGKMVESGNTATASGGRISAICSWVCGKTHSYDSYGEGYIGHMPPFGDSSGISLKEESLRLTARIGGVPSIGLP